MRKTHTHLLRRLKKFKKPNAIQAFALSIICAAGAFTLGMQTAGDVHPIAPSEAAVIQDTPVTRVRLKGDVNDDGKLDVRDAERTLELAEHLDEPTAEEVRRGDMDGDYQLTYKDVLRILHTLTTR